jgi:hypothetical protein
MINDGIARPVVFFFNGQKAFLRHATFDFSEYLARFDGTLATSGGAYLKQHIVGNSESR